MLENTNIKQFYPGPILNKTLDITDFLFKDPEQVHITYTYKNVGGSLSNRELTYGTEYEVAKILPSDVTQADAALTASTGRVTLKVDLNVALGERLTVYRESAIIQEAQYPRTGPFPAASHEGALDYLTMQNQEQQDQIDRSLKVPISTANFDGALPIPVPARALKINNSGSGFEFSEYDPDTALETTKEYMESAQTAALSALASQNAAASSASSIANSEIVATQQANIATQQAIIATNKTNEVVASGNEQVARIEATGNNYDNLTHRNITNCLLEVPQRIKLALEDGKMHLYKGSVLTYGDGTNLTIEEDVIEDQFVNTTHDDLIMVYDTQRTGNKLGIYTQGRNVFSQDTQPTTAIADSIWFDTASNKMKQTHDKGVTWYEIPLPIGVASVTPNVWKSLDRVFNGMGYVGSTVWVDKGVKGLIPNGRNKDGSLKNIEYVTPNLITRNITNNGSLELAISSSNTLTVYSYFTVSDENYLVGNNGAKVIGVSIASVYITGGAITNFQPKLPFRAVDYNEASGLGMPSNRYIELTLGATGSTYTAPANGWVQAVCNSSSDSPAFIEVDTEYASSTGTRYKGCWGRATIPVTKGRTFYVFYGGADFEIKMFRFTYAVGSESEAL